MQAMSEGMAALLKSGKQIGANRPTAEVIIGDGGSEFIGIFPPTGDTYYLRYSGYDVAGYRRDLSNFVVGADGKEFCVIRNTSTDELYLGYMDNNEDYLLMSYPITSVVATGIYNYWSSDAIDLAKQSLYKLSDGKILLFMILKPVVGTPCSIKCYVSNNGLGTDFTLLSTVYTSPKIADAGTSITGLSNIRVSICRKSEDGKLWLTAMIDTDYGGNYVFGERVGVFYSADNGESWTLSHSYANIGFNCVAVTSVCILPNGDLIYHTLSSTTQMRSFYSTNGGLTWSSTSNYYVAYDYLGDLNPSIVGTIFHIMDEIIIDGILFRAHGSTLPWLAVMSDPTIDKIISNEGFDSIWKYTPLEVGVEYPAYNYSQVWLEYNYNKNFVIYGKDTSDAILGVYAEIKDSSIQPKSIQISRSKGMAGQLTVEFDNKAGVLAPDGIDNPQLFWPNKEITVKQGYGAELIQTFKGLIDTISMSTFPQAISISARDKMKALLDHLARDSSFSYVLTYTGQTVEAIWQDLIVKAGLTYGTVETTGITLTEKVFSWQTYADCISWLDEIAGFETYCDEFGVMHFVYDGRPETVTVAYEFIEGVDIIQLGYDIDDKDLYYSVAVYGKDATDAVIYYAVTLPQAVYWNIPSGKVMRIDAPEADTSAKCQAIADKAIYLMQTRARQVRFSTIGIPHLQRGDFIQVTEASSTISEIYRITDISTSQGPDGYTMELTCYYHAAPEV